MFVGRKRVIPDGSSEIKEEMKGNSKYMGISKWISIAFNNSSLFSLTM